MNFYEERLEEDREYEEHMTCSVPIMVRESFVKIPTRVFQSVTFNQWIGKARASVASYLFGFVIRAKMGNKIANHLYQKYYVEQRLLVSRFTQQGLAERLGYRDRRGVNNHMISLYEEGIFKVHEEPWNGRVLRVYEFGNWECVKGNYIENVYMWDKFLKLEAERTINRLC